MPKWNWMKNSQKIMRLIIFYLSLNPLNVFATFHFKIQIKWQYSSLESHFLFFAIFPRHQQLAAYSSLFSTFFNSFGALRSTLTYPLLYTCAYFSFFALPWTTWNVEYFGLSFCFCSSFLYSLYGFILTGWLTRSSSMQTTRHKNERCNLDSAWIVRL